MSFFIKEETHCSHHHNHHHHHGHGHNHSHNHNHNHMDFEIQETVNNILKDEAKLTPSATLAHQAHQAVKPPEAGQNFIKADEFVQGMNRVPTSRYEPIAKPDATVQGILEKGCAGYPTEYKGLMPPQAIEGQIIPPPEGRSSTSDGGMPHPDLLQHSSGMQQTIQEGQKMKPPSKDSMEEDSPQKSLFYYFKKGQSGSLSLVVKNQEEAMMQTEPVTQEEKKNLQWSYCSNKSLPPPEKTCYVKINSGEKYQECSQCRKDREEGALLKQLSAQRDEEPFECDSCNMKTKWFLENRMRKHNDVSPSECSQCSLRLLRDSKLRNLGLHFEKYRCNHCTEVFTQESGLLKHLREHVRQRPFTCTQCDKKFLQKWHLQSHLKIHSGEKPYQCTYCDKKFSQEWNLLRHFRTHTGERPFECNHCGKKFGQKQHLWKHLKMHSGQKPYTCSHCNMKFELKSILKNHLASHMDGKASSRKCPDIVGLEEHSRSEAVINSFACDYCDRKFSHNGLLQGHLRTHVTQKNLECNQCDKKFSKEWDLVTHLRKHTG